MLTACATSFCSIFARAASSDSPTIGWTLTDAVTCFVGDKLAELARFLLVVQHDGVFDPGHGPHDFGERLLLGDLEPLARGCGRDSHGPPLSSAFSRIVLKFGGSAPASATAARYAACCPAGTRMRLPSRS